MTHSLNVLQAEKSSAQKELDEIKLSHAKLMEDHVAAVKHHDVELGTVKRNMSMAENERGALQRKIEDLTGQNQELAKAVAHQRGRLEDREQVRGLSDEDFETAPDNNTPEHSPPPSPVKGTPRHSMLESETLKSSLHHAHRMIQNLKGNIHREKTEKLELKRMLQDARDELDARRSELGSANGKRGRKVESKEFKKPLKPGQLGGLRSSRSEVFIDDPNWEEDDSLNSPSHSAAVNAARVAAGFTAGGVAAAGTTDSSDHFETANEASDAFETANERGTETEDFQTGVEDMSGSDGELTETEGGPAGTVRNKPTPLALSKAGNRQSFQSTASASGDEYSYEEVKTPTAQPQRLRLKVNRGGNRRSRGVSEEPLQGSPASFADSSRDGTPQVVGQSLFAELGDMGASDEDESIQGTPSRSTFLSQSATPASRPSTAKNTPAQRYASPPPPVPKLPMVDSGIMTEPWEPEPATPLTAVPAMAAAGFGGAALTEAAHLMSDKHTSTGSVVRRPMSDASSQWNDEQVMDLLNIDSQEQERSRPISTSTYNDMSSQYDPELMEEKLAKFPSPPSSRAHTPMASLSGLEAMATPLSMSIIHSEHVEPEIPATPARLTMSTIHSEDLEPRSEEIPAPLTVSTIRSEHVEPGAEPISAPLTMSNIVSEHVEPIEPESPTVPELVKQPALTTPKLAPVPVPLVFSGITSIHTEPIEPLSPRSPRRDGVILPREISDDEFDEREAPETPKPTLLTSIFGRNKGKGPATPIIAEDETRQSPNDSPMVETPESQRPFRELSSNTNEHERVVKKPRVETSDESSQTALTALQIDEMFKNKRKETILAEDGQRSPRTATVPAALRNRKSQESIGSVGRARAKMADPDFVHDTIPLKRPTSAGSARNGSISSIHPPLPTDHKQVIAEAAKRTGSSSGGLGSMGPPLLPASAYRANPSFRPRTPSSQPPMSPGSMKAGTTPRALHSSSGAPEVYPPSGTGRSRKSSVSSFASEIDNRFNMRAGMPMPNGLEPGTDPRMINAITQTMIGEYLWKYTRKAGRGAMSENRHRRYFWVHPYTRTLYWSDRDPSSAGRAELKAKSVPIEAVRVVTDDNPMPPGLHRKSLVIITPGRAVKFTATTGQRHETWFNALSYLLLRTGEEAVGDTSEVANGALTQEDVAEFNPAYGSNSTRRGPASLSSYNSRTTRNDSPARTRNSMGQPTLAQNSTSSRPSIGTFSRLSNYWKPKDGQLGSFSGRSGRHSVGGTGSIYEASEVHDSAEDLREMIEKQDRESDRLENVRACCDGKISGSKITNPSDMHRQTRCRPLTPLYQIPSFPEQYRRRCIWI